MLQRATAVRDLARKVAALWVALETGEQTAA